MNLLKEREIAINAVIKASKLCESVQKSILSDNTVQKQDNSPVTVADFGAQALIISEIGKVFPDIPFVAEEDAHFLVTDEGSEIRETVFKYVKEQIPDMTESSMIESINNGDYKGGSKGRFWTLDPIDGTKGFLRKDQYAVALALIQDGEVILGILGCPNLYSPGNPDSRDKGYIFSAVSGEGAYCRAIDENEEHRIYVTDISNTSEASFCESVESSHSSHDASQKVAADLGVTKEPIRIDSQCKYAIIAKGDASIYMRLPTRKGYNEKIWDHAAGVIIVEEAGGKVTDCFGNNLDFSLGTLLEKNKGIIATNGLIHDKVLEAVSKVVE